MTILLTRTIGLDLGSKRIGVALGTGDLATPYEVLHRTGDRARDHRLIADLAQEAGATTVVVGVPYSLDGSIGPAARRVLEEIDELAGRLDVGVETWDERLSTVTAEQALREQNVKGPDRRAIVDKVAASVILQAWLDAHPEERVSDDDWMDDDDWGGAWDDWDDGAPTRSGPSSEGEASLTQSEGWASSGQAQIRDGEERYEEWLEESGDPDDGWVDHRPPMGRGGKLLVGFGIVAVLLAAAVGGGYLWVQDKIDPPGEPGAELELEVAEGSTTEEIGGLLADNGVITSATVWDYWTRLENVGPFQAGLYVFQENSSFDEAVAVLDAGPRPPEFDRVTIPEGLTIAEIVPRLADPETGVERWTVENLRAAIEDPEIRSQFQPPEQPSMEGLLFPETYELDDEADERSFVRRLVTQMDETLLDFDIEAAAAALGRTPYEIVIVASLIEEEALVDGDRTKISRVIHNRLEQGIPLGIDATSRYEAEINGRSRDDLDFTSDSPYNTRRVQGLPPTPIAAPGRLAIEAALNPEPGPWIYYVLTDPDGSHTFAVTDAEFQEAKQECIRLDLGCG